MVDRLEITDVESGARNTVEVPDGPSYLVITSAGDVALRSEAPGAVLRLVPTRQGQRLEPMAQGGRVSVNGEELFCKDLRGGDTFELGGYRLRWIGGTAAVERGAPAVAARPRRRPTARRSSAPMWLLFSVCLGAIVLALRTCARSDWPRTPQHYVDLARTQYSGARFDEALATLDHALREASGPTRTEALDLRREIERALVVAADAVAVQKARTDSDLLTSFRDRYLGGTPTRPAARELVRLCDEWLQQHEARLRGAEGGAALLGEIRSMREALVEVAAIGSPDTAADVMFAARAHLRFRVREYRAAIARLDSFAAQHPEDAAVRQERAAIFAEGQQWLAEQLAVVQRMLQRGDRDGAADQFRALERHALLGEWEPLAAPVRALLK